jgi:RNA-binding protein
MRRLGEVARTAQGKLIVRSEDETYPDLGTTVLDENLDAVGTVVSIFGPVERPYLAVVPETQQIALLVGSPLYTRE